MSIKKATSAGLRPSKFMRPTANLAPTEETAPKRMFELRGRLSLLSFLNRIQVNMSEVALYTHGTTNQPEPSGHP